MDTKSNAQIRIVVKSARPRYAAAAEAAITAAMAGFMFKILFPSPDGAPPATNMVMAVGRDEAAARAVLDQFMNLQGEEKVTSMPVSDELVAFMGLREGESHVWKR